MRHPKYEEYVTGFDCGEDGFKDTDFETPEEYFNYVKMRIENAEPGTVVFADDYRPLDQMFIDHVQDLYVTIHIRIHTHAHTCM